MPRLIGLSSRSWTDRGLEAFVQKAAEWGYAAIELDCQGEHLAIQRALSEPDYPQRLVSLLEKHEIRLAAICNRMVGQVVGEDADERHQAGLPDYVWGDGQAHGVRDRASEELAATARVAHSLGVNLIATCGGSPHGQALFDYPPVPRAWWTTKCQEWVERWLPILQEFQALNLRLAFEVQPGQMAFDLYSAEAMLNLFQGSETIGFAVDPGQLHWQGVDPVEFIQAFPDRIFMIYWQDAALNLNGRTGILGSRLTAGDPRRGRSCRAPGHGSVDWSSLVRALHRTGYEGPWIVKAEDPEMDRDFLAQEAAAFVRRMDFEPARHGFDPHFMEG